MRCMENLIGFPKLHHNTVGSGWWTSSTYCLRLYRLALWGRSVRPPDAYSPTMTSMNPSMAPLFDWSTICLFPRLSVWLSGSAFPDLLGYQETFSALANLWRWVHTPCGIRINGFYLSERMKFWWWWVEKHGLILYVLVNFLPIFAKLGIISMITELIWPTSCSDWSMWFPSSFLFFLPSSE